MVFGIELGSCSTLDRQLEPPIRIKRSLCHVTRVQRNDSDYKSSVSRAMRTYHPDPCHTSYISILAESSKNVHFVPNSRAVLKREQDCRSAFWEATWNDCCYCCDRSSSFLCPLAFDSSTIIDSVI
jgi:hypothetical protein